MRIPLIDKGCEVRKSKRLNGPTVTSVTNSR